MALWAGIAALTIAAYAPVRNFGFISLDDPQYVSANPVVGQGLSWRGVKWAFWGSHGFYWHPLTWLSHQLDVQLFGMDAGSHHVMSLLFHVVNSLLVYLALARMTGAIGKSAFVAAMFALHPLHVESVAWIAERKDVLSTFFAMFAVLTYIGYVRDPRRYRFLLVMFWFVCALMSKPMVVTLPLVLLLLDYWPLQRVQARSARIWWLLVREKLLLFALAAIASVVTVVNQREVGAVIPLESFSLADRLGNSLASYVAYARDVFWPTRLAVYYPLQPPGALVTWVALALLVSVTLVAWRLRHGAPYFLIGILWYFVTLAPVIGVIQAGAQGRADRFTYVPAIGLFVAAAWGISDLFRALRRPMGDLAVGAAALTLACAAITRKQAGYWESNLTLWGRAVSVTSHNYWAEDRLGVALADDGRLDQAIDHYTAALAIWPEFAEAHNNLGTARVDQGRTDDAINEFGEAVRIRPNDAMFHYNLAVVLNTAGRTSEATREITTAIHLRPDDSSFARARSIITGGRGK